MVQRTKRLQSVCGLAVWLLLVTPGVAQTVPETAAPAATSTPATPPAVTAPPVVTIERIDQFQKSLEAAPDLPEADRAQIAELIKQATADLKAAEAAELQAKEFEQRAGEVETLRVELEKQLAQPPESVKLSAGRSIADLESERVDAQAKVNELEQALKQPAVDPAARTARRKTARAAVSELPATLADLEQRLKVPAPDGEPPLLTEARKLELSAQVRAVTARLAQHQKELALYDAADAVNLPQQRREAMTRELNTSLKRIELLGEEINRLRQAEAEQRAKEAEIAAINAQPLLKPILEESLEIARTEQELRSQHEDDKALLQSVQSRLKEIQTDADEAARLDKQVGLAKMGIWLRKQRDQLQDLDPLTTDLESRSEKETSALFAYYEREEQLNDLADIEALADELVAQAAAEGEIDTDSFRDDAIQVLRSQSVNLQKLVDEYGNYTVTLAALAEEHERLQQVASDYTEFLDERILWVRSHLPLSWETLKGEGETIRNLIRLDTWSAAGKSLAWDAVDHLPLYGSVSLMLLLLISSRGRNVQRLQNVAKQATGRVTTSLGPTLHCLVLTVWLAIAGPGLVLFMAWRLHESSISSTELRVAAINLARLASVFFLLEFVRQSVRCDGLAEAHFAWNRKMLRRVRRLLWSVIIVGLPMATAVACLHQQDPASRRDGIERVFFVLAMLVLTAFAHGMLHPVRGALPQLKLVPGGWFDRLNFVWYLLGIGVPLFLAGLAVAGYYDTTVRLALKVQRTMWLVVLGGYVHALLLRWLMLRHRRMRIDKARERLAAAQEGTKSSVETGAPMPEAGSTGADLDAISQQSERLLTTALLVACLVGVWYVWFDVLPAIRFLDRWPIWDSMVQSVVLETNETTGETTTRLSYELQSITIASLLDALVIIFLTSTAARNVPGLLEISILPRLPIDRSTAYAITSLTRYGLVLLGLILTSRTLGIGWQKVQWLAAALTFGLGFGLQEIFANFVSGLIILFEQPVRVGDVVTIDGVSGVVNRIRIRATTIVDWDRKEYVVPNRDFITGRLMNWTLSDKMNRVVINVGVAYGSNPAEVRSIIMQLLQNHPNVLDDPPPLVTFESFGESALDFVVRAYLPDLEYRLQTIHDLHTGIHDGLRQAGIEIPFPQRDIHLRSQVPLGKTTSLTGDSNGQAKPTLEKHSPTIQGDA